MKKTASLAKNIHTQRGVTLIELLVVLVIISVLAAMVVPQFFGQADEAKIKVAKSDISNISNAVEIYKLNNGKYPASLNDLVGKGKVFKKEPLDPWQNPYQFSATGDGFTVISTGADGAVGGSGINSDIKNE